MRASMLWRLAALATFTACTSLASSVDAQTIAITGGTVYPVSGPKIENGTVLIANGRITAVGRDVQIPDGATRIDARGKWVTPGFINSATTLGLAEGGSPQFSGGYNDQGARGEHGISASFKAWRGINPASTFFAPARDEGVTSVVGAGGHGMISGKMARIDPVEGRTASDFVRKGPAAMVGAFGSPGAGETDSRAEYWAKWRSLMNDVRRHKGLDLRITNSRRVKSSRDRAAPSTSQFSQLVSLSCA